MSDQGIEQIVDENNRKLKEKLLSLIKVWDIYTIREILNEIEADIPIGQFVSNEEIFQTWLKRDLLITVKMIREKLPEKHYYNKLKNAKEYAELVIDRRIKSITQGEITTIDLNNRRALRQLLLWETDRKNL
jgi:hypothetical protein